MNKKSAVVVSSLVIIVLVLIFSIVITTSLNDIENKITSTQANDNSVESINKETLIIEDTTQNTTQKQPKTVPSVNNKNKYESYINSIITSHINSSMSDYQKIKTIHDYIIINTSYDTSTELPNSSFSPEGVFLKGIAVCQGYAEAFQLFMDALKIESKIVKGTANNISHAWNVVKVNGFWYQIDVTWDDPIIDDQVKTGTDNLTYSYFLKPDSIFNKDHIPSSTPPPCTATDYLYIEQYYNIPYTILGTVNDIPSKFMEYFATGTRSLTIYFPENVDPADTELLKDLYKLLFTETGAAITFNYYPVKQYVDYSYITIFIE